MTSKEFLRPATTMNHQRNLKIPPPSSLLESLKKTPYYSKDSDYYTDHRPFSSGMRLFILLFLI